MAIRLAAGLGTAEGLLNLSLHLTAVLGDFKEVALETQPPTLLYLHAVSPILIGESAVEVTSVGLLLPEAGVMQETLTTRRLVFMAVFEAFARYC